MGVKVTFNPVDYRIEVTVAPVSGLTTLDFQVDVYSDGKEDWLANDSLARHEFPIRAVGGEPLPGGLTLDATYFIIPPWTIYPYDANHELTVSGNVFRTDGANIVTGRAGRTIALRLLTTFSTGASASIPTPGDVATAVWDEARAMTLGKFIALK